MSFRHVFTSFPCMLAMYLISGSMSWCLPGESENSRTQRGTPLTLSSDNVYSREMSGHLLWIYTNKHQYCVQTNRTLVLCSDKQNTSIVFTQTEHQYSVYTNRTLVLCSHKQNTSIVFTQTEHQYCVYTNRTLVLCLRQTGHQYCVYNVNVI